MSSAKTPYESSELRATPNEASRRLKQLVAKVVEEEPAAKAPRKYSLQNTCRNVVARKHRERFRESGLLVEDFVHPILGTPEMR